MSPETMVEIRLCFLCQSSSPGTTFGGEPLIYQRDYGGFSHSLGRYGDTMLDGSMGGNLRIDKQSISTRPLSMQL